MHSTEFLFLLISSTIITILLSEKLKILLNKTESPYRANIVALDSAMVSSTGMSMIHRWGTLTEFGEVHLLRLVMLILLTWLVSMVVYDKLQQIKEQYKQFKYLKDKENLKRKSK